MMTKVIKLETKSLLYDDDEFSEEDERSTELGSAGKLDPGAVRNMSTCLLKRPLSHENDADDEGLDEKRFKTENLTTLVCYDVEDEEDEDEELNTNKEYVKSCDNKQGVPEIVSDLSSGEERCSSETLDYLSSSKELTSKDDEPASPGLRLCAQDVQMPPAPTGKCCVKLQKKVEDLYSKVFHGGFDMNRKIENTKNFRNPGIYSKLIELCGIDEKGTNYEPNIYNPRIFGEESNYMALSKRLEEDEMERLKKKQARKLTVGQVQQIKGTKK